jgi:hypothetical protein
MFPAFLSAFCVAPSPLLKRRECLHALVCLDRGGVIDGPETADAVAAEIMKTPVRRGSRISSWLAARDRYFGQRSQ